MKLAVQLYTIRDETAKDFIGALEKVAQIGYKGVEFAGYGDLKAADMRAHLDRLGLKAAGSHVGLDLLRDKLEETIEYNVEIGNKYLVCPYAKFDTKQEWVDFAHLLNKVGEKCRQKGLMVGYHNHSHEFAAFDGEYVLDMIFRETDPELVIAEIDTYWVQYAGVDPAEYIKKYAGRLPLVHQKDMKAGEDKGFTEVGSGIMDIKSIYNTSAEIGAQWFVVEQDKCEIPSFDSITISYENLKKMGLI